MYEKYKLKNNLTVILAPQQDTKAMTAMVMFPVGSRYEPEYLAGSSHYIEHMMFKGTKKRKNTLALTREIDRLGARYNAFTGKEYTGYYIKASASYAKTSLDILSDMIFNSTFDKKEMEREKGPIIEEIRMYNDNPMMNIDNIFEDVLYAGCPLGRDIAGTVEHVKGYKRDDVLAYKEKHYQPSNTILVLSGKIDEKTKVLVEQYFGQEKDSKKPVKTFKPAAFGPATKKDRFFVEKKQTDQAQLMLGFPAFEYGAKENPAVSLMNSIFGGSMSSRLFIQIRERRGLAYMIRSGRDTFHDSGYVYVRAGLEAKNIKKAMEVIQSEIDKLIEKGVSKRELLDAKTHVRGSLTLAQEDSSFWANWYAKEALFAKKIQTPEEYIQKLEAVTQEDIVKVAKQIFKPKQMRVAIIGDVDKKDIII
ncbi:MAG: insulinase family protein [Candidatus Magasanikbacteria bacterium]|jgi:predicted Zn-dependent peptidase|nr:insulinase family protein [Candidatus Magasanikbacteria bacterium]MBT4071792.1 insulinase family protein [Candidatus Magasanikbacteria bacterium]